MPPLLSDSISKLKKLERGSQIVIFPYRQLVTFRSVFHGASLATSTTYTVRPDAGSKDCDDLRGLVTGMNEACTPPAGMKRSHQG